MYYLTTVIVSSIVVIVYSCIPTQQVDPVTTTTVATTTTTVTEPPFPCMNCPKIYDTTCMGIGIPDLLTGCPTAAEAGIEYTLGLITSIIPFIPAGSCGTIITCPLTTSLRIKTPLGDLPAPVLYAWCEETGPYAGVWYTGASLFPRIELVSLACTPVISANAWIEEVNDSEARTLSNVTKPRECSVCRNIYDTECRGVGVPNKKTGCATAIQARIYYELDGLRNSSESLSFIPAGACGTLVTCPLTTQMSLQIPGGRLPSPVLYVWCEESGPNQGVWYTGASWHPRIEVLSVACIPIN